MNFFKKLFSAEWKQKETVSDNGFEAVLEKVESDEADLARLESRMHDEFEEIEGGVKNICLEVDRAVGKKGV